MPVDACFVQVALDPTKYWLAGAGLAVALASLLALKRFQLSGKGKIGLIYLHLTSLFFPLAVFATNQACGMLCLPCFESPAGIAVLALPSALALGAIAGFVVIPSYFLLTGRNVRLADKSLLAFVRRQSKRMGIRQPRMYAAKDAKPYAFSFRTFRSAVVLSVGMLDILNRKEIEAVILHELAHLQSRASAFKVSAYLMRLSPFWLFKGFSAELNQEELAADAFASAAQGSARHLNSAKRKLAAYRKER
ncbi:MAG: M48 family metalloprotease [Candidatus Aenigmarchaeota archaeon]|nr:M48 family metalloprotease [Candidatus Aenigmarchaeota archaeon]